jgi:hypothetical protein
MRRSYVLLGAGCAALAVLLPGCGSDGGARSAARTGSLSIGVRFPSQGAVLPATIPSHAESVRISIRADGGEAHSTSSDAIPESRASLSGPRLVPDAILNRPPGGGLARATIAHVPAGPAIVRAAAHAQRDGQGAELATACAPVVVIADKTTDVTLTLVEVVERVVASPTSLLMLVGEKAQVTARAVDAAGATVVGAALDYSSDDPSVAAVDATGMVEAVALGATSVRVTHAASGAQVQIPVQVVRARVVRVGVTVDRPVTVPGVAVRFAAAAFDDLGRLQPNAQFDWSVEKPAMGSVDADGRFTPARVGVAGVIASERQSATEGVGRVDVAEWALLLEWSAAVDLDLHVFDGTRHAYFDSPAIPAGELLADSTAGPGVEGFAGNTAYAGRLPVAVNYFRGQRDASGVVTLLVKGATPVSSAFTLTEASGNQGYPVSAPTESWCRPFDVVITPTGAVLASNPDLNIRLGPAGRAAK